MVTTSDRHEHDHEKPLPNGNFLSVMASNKELGFTLPLFSSATKGSSVTGLNRTSSYPYPRRFLEPCGPEPVLTYRRPYECPINRRGQILLAADGSPG